jgi:hypothetical protein
MDSPWPNNAETGIFLENQTLALSLTGLQPYIPEQMAMSSQHYSSPTSIPIFADHSDAAAHLHSIGITRQGYPSGHFGFTVSLLQPEQVSGHLLQQQGCRFQATIGISTL